jgi:hypothetical protein
MDLHNHMQHVVRELADRMHAPETGERTLTRAQATEERKAADKAFRTAVDLPARNAYTADRALILIENVRVLAGELAGLIDYVDGPVAVNARALIERLRAAEVNLEAACGDLPATSASSRWPESEQRVAFSV